MIDTSSCQPEPSINANAVIASADDIASRYGLASLNPLLVACKDAVAGQEISVAVVGRFKAGKSSFLNHYLDRELLPVGVLPVTTVVTEMSYGPLETATIDFLDGRTGHVSIKDVGEFVAEKRNPGNRKNVGRVLIELPSLKRLRGLRFVDMPGLESVLEHNTEASLDWLPNVGLALVAISVDPPLTQQDVTLLRNLYQHTPHVSVLLTKADLVSKSELQELVDFVRDRLAKAFGSSPKIFPYSVVSGFQEYRDRLDSELITPMLADFKRRRSELLQHKLNNLLRECGGYLNLALTSAEMVDSERGTLSKQILGEGEELTDVKAEIRLILQSARGGARSAAESRLASHRPVIEQQLLRALQDEYSSWTKSFKTTLESFESWLARELSDQLSAISSSERRHLVAPLDKANRQILRVLQGFRDHLSDRAERVFGVPLRTTEIEISIEEPRIPDIRIGRVFDHNWELLSGIAPMRLLRSVVLRHFERKLPYMIEKNISRVTSQWEQSLVKAINDLQLEAERRLDELAGTIRRMLLVTRDSAPGIRSDIETIRSLGTQFEEAASRNLTCPF